jgi:glycolate oxidase
VQRDDLLARLTAALSPTQVRAGDAVAEEELGDESLAAPAPARPLAVVRPRTTAEVATVARLATSAGVALVPRGSGTGLSGAARAQAGSILVNFAEMNAVLSVSASDHVAVVQPGVTLRQLNEHLIGSGLHYPVHPGELSGSLGGNVNTNAGGMRAVRHGVTRHHVLGLELVLADGTVLRTGAPVVKSSSGYDLTQLVIGSEGTLALVTEVTLRLSPVMPERATVLVPFATLEGLAAVVPEVVAAGLEPSMLEYLDLLTMSAVTQAAGIELGVPVEVAAATGAYLVVLLETRTAEQLERDLADLAQLVGARGALDLYVLSATVGPRLIEARERAFWVAKAAGADEIVDVVVPRSRVPEYLAEAADIAARHGGFVSGCGHVGDGNVHLSVFAPEAGARHALLHDLFAAGLARGGQISGEHGIGADKRELYRHLSDPALLALQARVKAAFDPRGLLNPHLGVGA